MSIRIKMPDSSRLDLKFIDSFKLGKNGVILARGDGGFDGMIHCDPDDRVHYLDILEDLKTGKLDPSVTNNWNSVVKDYRAKSLNVV